MKKIFLISLLILPLSLSADWMKCEKQNMNQALILAGCGNYYESCDRIQIRWIYSQKCQ